MNQDRRINELERRLNNLLMIGTVAEVDPERARCRVQVGEITTAWLLWMTPSASEDRTWWAPSVGEQVMVMSPSGETAQGVVLPAINQRAHPAPSSNPDVIGRWLPDGTRLEYDSEKSRLLIHCVGDIHLEVIGDLTANVGGDMKATVAGVATVDAESIHHNQGSSVVTTAHICHFTGNPHGDGSSTVTAGK